MRGRKIRLQVKQVMASFRFYDNSNVIATLIKTNFHVFIFIEYSFGSALVVVFPSLY